VDDNVYQITNVPARKKAQVRIEVPEELKDTRTLETDRAFLLTMFTEEQIEDLREHIRFASHCTEGEFGNGNEPDDMDVADVVNWFQDQGWTQPLAGLK
jgi:hypothetical protein